MPDVYAHIVFADIVAGRLGLNLDKSLLYFGSQGPDIIGFMFPSLSGQMHDGDALLLEKLAGDEKLFPVYIGYHTHFSLDNRLHPIIKSHSPTLKTHLLIESCLDQIIVQKYWKKELCLLKMDDYIPVTIPDYISTTLDTIINAEFSFKLPEQFWKSALENYFRIYKEALEGKSDVVISYSEYPQKTLEDLLGLNDFRKLTDAFGNAVEEETLSLSSCIKLKKPSSLKNTPMPLDLSHR
jgi:hypothetical protein